MQQSRQVTSRMVSVDGGELYVEERGSGEPLLLIQGLGYASWGWRYQSELASRWRVIAFDHRGTGRSPRPEGTVSIETMAGDAAAVLDALDALPAHVLGFSMGGYIAQVLARQRPGAVASLVLVATSCGGPGHEPVPDSTRQAWLDASPLPPAEYARATMRLSFSPGWADSHPDEYEALLAARLEHPTPPDVWAEQFAACESFLARGASVEHLEVPTLVIHGDADRVVPPGNGAALARRIRGAQLVTMAGRGHLTFLEDWATFNETVAGFLADTAANDEDAM